MPANESTRHRFTMELTDEELATLDELVRRIQERSRAAKGVAEAHIKVTRRSVIVEALELLQSREDEREADKGRKR